ncbi:MAG: PaaI family thioesterase [Syntrophales bacterium]
MNELPENILALLNEIAGGFNKLLGLDFIKAAPDEYVAEIKIDERHLQPYGIVHGGVYSGMIETLCSAGAALSVYSEGKSAVGLENSTSFLRAVRSGVLRCTARPILKGKRSHVWEAQVTDDRERLIATGRVRLIILEQGSEADGITVGLNR